MGSSCSKQGAETATHELEIQVPRRPTVLPSPHSMQRETHTEHRRTPRIAVDLPARYRSQTVQMDGRAGNLSQDGMFFVTPYLDAPPEEVAVELDLPDEDGP